LSPSDHNDEHSMPFLDHLEELRWVILKSLVAMLAGVLICWAFTDTVYAFFLRPLAEVRDEVTLVFSGPLDAFLVKLKMALLSGVVLAAPVVLWFVWAFVRPGLKRAERRLGFWTVTAGTFFFLVGAGFAYAAIPFVLRFLVSFSPEGDGIEQLWRLKTYIDFAFRLVLACGVLFELPVVMVVAVRLDLVTPEALAKGRPYAIVLAFLIAAILTPPDIITQIMLGVPLVLLYELGLLAGRWQTRARRNTENR